MIDYFNCPIHYPITVNCPIALFDYSSTECIMKNKAANAPTAFEEIVMVMIKYIILTDYRL